MDQIRWKQMQELFRAALDKTPPERSAFLREACTADAGMLAELEQLLAANDMADGLLDKPMIVPGDLPDPDEFAQRLVGRRVGSYEIRRVIASGGMGVVYEALQASPQRTVALKLMRHGLRSPLAQRRFHDESRVMARLQHPGICQIFEAGIHPSEEGPVPFFAMELIRDASTLTEYAAGNGLGERERLGLFAQVCDAVDHGHLRGVIHRDLKPANILVEPQGQPKVIDFGIARLTDVDVAAASLPTSPGQPVGTLQYMSPEQCTCDPEGLDIRTDVYSLGVVLYELLTEALPYKVSTTNFIQAAQTIREVRPRHPSQLNNRLSGDQEVIILKALEKEPALRYQSMPDLAADIRRYLAYEPILARRPSGAYQLRLLARRHRGVFRAAALTVIALLTATAVSIWSATRARQASFDAEIHAYAEGLSAAAAAVDRNDVADARERLLQAERRLLANAGSSAEPRWELRHLRCRLDQSLFAANTEANQIRDIDISPDGQLLAVALNDDGWQLWRMVNVDNAPQLEKAHAEPWHDGLLASYICFLPHADSLVVSLFNNQVQRFETWNVTQPTRPALVESRQFSAHGQYGLVAARKSEYAMASWSCQLISLWTGALEQPQPLGRHQNSVNSLRFDPQERFLASSSNDLTVRLWNLEHRTPAAILLGHTDHVRGVEFGPGGKELITVALDGTIRIWDVDESVREYARSPASARGIESAALRGGNVGFRCSALQPGGGILACGGTDNTVRLWELDLRRRGRVWQRPALTHSWAVSRHREIAVLRGHSLPVVDVAFSPDGRWLVSGGEDGQLRVWAAGPSTATPVFEGHGSSVTSVSFHPSGRWFASGAGDWSVRLWDIEAGQGVASLYDHGGRITDVVFSPSGRLLASASMNELIVIREVADGGTLPIASQPWAMTETFDAGHDFRQLAFSADDRRLAACKSDGLIKVWQVGPDHSSTNIFEHQATCAVNAVVFLDPAGRFLVTGGGGQRDTAGRVTVTAGDVAAGRLRVWDLDRPNQPQGEITEDSPITALALAPGKKSLAVGCSNGTLTLWKVHSTSVERLWTREQQHTDEITALVFHPDGSRLFSGSRDKSVRIWDPSRGDVLAVFRGHIGNVLDLTLDPSSGSRLLTASAGLDGLDNVIGLWETQAEARLTMLRARRALARSRAEDVVTQLFNDCVSAEEVIEQLPALGLDDEVRESAVRLARFLGDEPTLLMWKCWDCVWREDRPAGEYADALRRAELADRIVPQRFEHEGLLQLARGLALHRLGRHDETLANLTSAEVLCSQVKSDLMFMPAAIAAQALALHALGRPAEARDCLARITAEIDAANQPDPGVPALLAEAARVIGP